ncbi:MMPL family transporter [Flaviflagellibacter deserti]|uniref:MMPL family transporter n=1 Tax=Flaviflagellibacter deserti TaxID=2267266 RepID=A0ABV9YX79_9HYPH
MKKMGERILLACAEICARKPWLVLFVTAILTGLSIYASTFLTINTNTDEVLSRDLPFRQIEQEYRKSFPKEESIVVVVDAATPADADLAADNLAVRLRARPEQFLDVQVPGSSPFFNDNGLLYLDQPKLKTFVDQIEQSKPVLQLFARDPSLRGIESYIEAQGDGSADADRFGRTLAGLGETAQANADGDEKRTDWLSIFGFQRPEGRPGTRRMVLAKPKLDNSSINRAGPALDALREEMKGVQEEEAEGLQMHITGDPTLRQQELNDAFSGAIAASGFSFVLVALSLIIGIRSGRLIAALLITLVIGSMWTTGLAAMSVGRLNLISVAFMVLFFGLGVDFGTHLGLRYLEELKKKGTFEAAMKESMLGEGPSIALSTLCASLAFLSFVPTSYVGLAEFGIISALGMVVALVMTFTVQPALMAVMPPKLKPSRSFDIGIGSWVQKHYKAILVVSAVVTFGSLYFARDARIDVNPLNLQNPTAEPVVTFRDLAKDPLTSPYALNVVADNLDDARTLAEKLDAAPGVEGVQTAEVFLPKDQAPKLALLSTVRNSLGPDFFDPNATRPAPSDAELTRAFQQLRDTAASLAQSGAEGSEVRAGAEKLRDGLAAYAEKRGIDLESLKVLQDNLVGSMPDIVDALRTRIGNAKELTLADLPPEIAKDWIAPDGKLRLRVMPTGDVANADSFRTFADTVQAISPKASGVPISVTEAGNEILWAFVEAIIYTTIAIGLVVIIMRRRVSDVLLVLAPLAVAALWTVAASAILDLPFNFANVIVIPLLIGLGVAGSIHIVVRAREMSDEHHAHPDRPRGNVLDTSTSLAVLVAQLNTVAAFATLAISHHRGLYSMGMLLGISIFFVVIVCLVVLPAAMIALNPKHRLEPSDADD